MRSGRFLRAAVMQNLIIQVISLKENRIYLAFTATSETLGVYNRVIYISEDGYFATNILDYEYSYFIGKEAAGQIIRYVQKHSTETKSSSSVPTISGTVTEIGDGYMIVDNTALCRSPKAGKEYKVYTDDIRVKDGLKVERSRQEIL